MRLLVHVTCCRTEVAASSQSIFTIVRAPIYGDSEENYRFSDGVYGRASPKGFAIDVSMVPPKTVSAIFLRAGVATGVPRTQRRSNPLVSLSASKAIPNASLTPCVRSAASTRVSICQMRSVLDIPENPQKTNTIFSYRRLGATQPHWRVPLRPVSMSCRRLPMYALFELGKP